MNFRGQALNMCFTNSCRGHLCLYWRIGEQKDLAWGAYPQFCELSSSRVLKMQYRMHSRNAGQGASSVVQDTVGRSRIWVFMRCCTFGSRLTTVILLAQNMSCSADTTFTTFQQIIYKNTSMGGPAFVLSANVQQISLGPKAKSCSTPS